MQIILGNCQDHTPIVKIPWPEDKTSVDPEFDPYIKSQKLLQI